MHPVIQRPRVEPAGVEEGNRQRFVIAPLEPGFGHTIGNSIRRVLLSSIPGSAVTQVRFDEALHEFDTVGGVVEDVTDIILNLKDLVVVCRSDGPVALRLDMRGPAIVRGSDLSDNPDVEILNPDLHIATMDGEGRLALEVTIAQGRGYVSAERNKSSGPIGVIPVDSIFSPVRKATFSVEPTRVEQDTNYDRLTIDIQTDGSISPSEALASAGDTLRSLVGLIADMSEEPQGLEPGEIGLVGSGPSDLDQPIEDLELSERPRNCLKRAQVNSIGDLLDKTEADLLAITNFGQKSLDEVVDKLGERGLTLRLPRVGERSAAEPARLRPSERGITRARLHPTAVVDIPVDAGSIARRWGFDEATVLAFVGPDERSIVWTTNADASECMELVRSLIPKAERPDGESGPTAFLTVVERTDNRSQESQWEINASDEFMDLIMELREMTSAVLVRYESRTSAWVWETPEHLRQSGTLGVIFAEDIPESTDRVLTRTFSGRREEESLATVVNSIRKFVA